MLMNALLSILSVATRPPVSYSYLRPNSTRPRESPSVGKHASSGGPPSKDNDPLTMQKARNIVDRASYFDLCDGTRRMLHGFTFVGRDGRVLDNLSPHH